MKTLRLEPVRRPAQMRSYWSREWRVVLVILFSGTAFNGAMSLGPVVLGRILDLLQTGAAQPAVLRRCIGYLALIGGVQLLRFVKRSSVRVFANRTGAAMRQTVYHTILSRSLQELRQEQAGDLMTRAVSDVNACVEGMRKFTTEVFDTGVLMASYLVTLLLYDWRLTLLSCVSIPLAMLLAEQLKALIYRCTKAYRAQLSDVAQGTYEAVSGATMLRICGAEARWREEYARQLERLRQKAVRASVLENSMQPIYHLISLGGVILIIWQGGLRTAAGAWTVGDFSAYLTIFAALAVKASKAAKLFNSVEKARVSWKRIQPYLEEYTPIAPACLPEKSTVTLTLTAVSVIPPEQDKPVLEQVTCSGRTGQIVGITGPVACGKSTLGMTLQGLYPYSGSIRLNGRELRELLPEERAGFCLYLGHGGALFSDTIRQNVALGDPGDTEKVLSQVCFDPDLKGMPQGADTMVGAGGARLSGGQQARIALARTLYHKRPVLVLDDPFSAVDAATEARILRCLREDYRDCLILLISHRVRSFEQLDGVLLLEPGGARFGSHAQLLAQSPLYREIVALQEGGDAQ